MDLHRKSPATNCGGIEDKAPTAGNTPGKRKHLRSSSNPFDVDLFNHSVVAEQPSTFGVKLLDHSVVTDVFLLHFIFKAM